MEFERRDAMDGVDGLINEASFAELLLMHAQIPEKRQKVMLKRVKRKFKSAEGISFDETLAFSNSSTTLKLSIWPSISIAWLGSLSTRSF